MKRIILIAGTLMLVQTSFGQKKYFTKAGVVSFKAGTALEDIDAVNKTTTCIFDASSGQLEFALLVKGFEFKRALMQEHFNENYMESSKFPRSVFKGKITNIDKVNFQQDGSYPVNVKGALEIHGVKKEVVTNGVLKVSGESVLSTAEFSIVLDDYNIEIPGLVKDKISKTAVIKVSCNNSILK